MAAGRALSALICTNEFGHSNLYNYIQILWYIRSLYSLGSLHCFLGNLDVADEYLKECLANDLHDKLGAWHKQLCVALQRQGVVVGPDSVRVR